MLCTKPAAFSWQRASFNLWWHVCILGDNTVSRSSHAIVVYDPRSNVYLAQPGSSKELFYVNDKLVLNPIELKAMDQLSIGDTKLMFVPLCSEKFHW